ncbi:hypothetical protein, partial [Mediterraneibacter gnavus]|uniref:hypothetical protein n=1 Tax=Mediterraneibacter gnavus TaxID=33038 RepID=UPI0006DC47F1
FPLLFVIESRKSLCHSLGRPSRSDFVQFLFEKLRKRNIEQKRNAQFLAYRELCIFVNKYF